MANMLIALQGTAAVLEVYEDRVEIVPRGALGKLSQRGAKVLYLRQISGVQFKKATAFAGGYLSFTLIGGREKSGGVLGASANENSVLFPKKENETAETARRKIEELIAVTSVPATSAAAYDGADELLKFKSLLDQGAITQEEYDQQKKRILGP